MSQIDREGVYRGTIVESGLSLTRANKYPQWVARLKATEKWVETEEEMKHFELSEPGWVQWDYDENIVAYMVLFKANAETGEQCLPGQNDMLNYHQLQVATGWNGSEFDALCDASLIGKSLQFRVAPNTYEGKTTLQVQWLDAYDADPVRQLRVLNTEQVKGLNRLLKGVKPSVPKPASKPSSAPQPTVSAAKPSSQPQEVAPVKTETPAPPRKAKTKAKAPTKKAEEFPDMTQAEAWKAVLEEKGEADDTDVEDAWIASCQEIGGDRIEDEFTGFDWAKVRAKTIERLQNDPSI